MPAILRIFPYQTDASLSVLGHIGSYDQGVVGSDRVSIWNNMPLGPSRRMCLSHNASRGILLSSLWPVGMS